MRSRYRFYVFIFLFGIFVSCMRADDKKLIVLSDLEVDNFFRNIITKIYSIANVNRPVRIFLIQDESVNAFATYGGNVCINTGSVKALNSAGEIFGLLAHEIGHVCGKHVELITEYENRHNKIALLTFPLLPLTMTLLMEERLKYYRGTEKAADNFAINVFCKGNYSLSYLKKTFQILQQESRLHITRDLDENIVRKLTHPAHQDRLCSVDIALKRQKNARDFDLDLETQFKFIKYKVIAYTMDPDEFLSNYTENVTDEIAYGRAVAYGRIGEVEKSREIFNFLINKYRDNKYFIYTAAEVFFENGKIKDALKNYKMLSGKLTHPDDKVILNVLIARCKMAMNNNWNPNEILVSIKNSLMKDIKVLGEWQFNKEIIKIFIACYDKLKDSVMKKVYLLLQFLVENIENSMLDEDSLKKIKENLKYCLNELKKDSNNYNSNVLFIQDSIDYIDRISNNSSNR